MATKQFLCFCIPLNAMVASSLVYAPSASGAEAAPSESSAVLTEVIVTARKSEENILDVPISVTALSAESLERLNIRAFDNILLQVPNVGFAHGTSNFGFGASRSVAIRGISGAGTAAVYIDDTPIPESLDPRVVDIERVEVLKGPQGTLFGQSSLGGTLRLITVTPTNDPDLRYEVRAGGTKGSADANYAGKVSGNHTFADGALTARFVAFGEHTAGFITRSYPDADGRIVKIDDQGSANAWGGSLTMQWTPTENLSATLRVMYQQQTSEGWPTTYAPLPGFKIESLTLPSPVNLQETLKDQWYLPALTVRYSGEGFSLVSSVNYFNRSATFLEDSSIGTQWSMNNSGGFLPTVSPTQAFAWEGLSRQINLTNENRLTFDERHGFSGIIGTYYSRQDTNGYDKGPLVPGLAAGGYTTSPGYCPDGGTSCPSYNSDVLWYSTYPTERTYEALFGEAYYDWNQWQFTVGLRGYRNEQSTLSRAEGAFNGAHSFVDLGTTKQTGVVPKAAVTFKVTQTASVYATVAKGFRAGGANQPLGALCADVSALGIEKGKPSSFKSDSVWNYEVGAKTQLNQGRLLLTTALFQMNWDQIQQSYVVPVCFFGITVNQGAARVRGGELEVTAQPLDGVELHLGLGYNDAKITERGLPSLPAAGTRVPIVPQWTGNFSTSYSRLIGAGLTGFVSGDVSYTGDSLSYRNTISYPATRAAYTLVNASFGVRWDRAELSIYGANLGNKHPNLGDLYATGVVAHTSLAPEAPILPRVATLQPLTVGIQFRQGF